VTANPPPATVARSAVSASRTKPARPQKLTPARSTTTGANWRVRAAANTVRSGASVYKSISPATRNTTICPLAVGIVSRVHEHSGTSTTSGFEMEYTKAPGRRA
jgi:hypothetical protein